MTGPPDRPARAPLPEDAASLPGLGEAFEATIRDGLVPLGLTLGSAQLAALDAQARLLLAWTGAINLTAHRSARQVALLHVVDSLTAVPLLRATAPVSASRHGGRAPGRCSLLDLGSGGGYPGLPIAIVLPADRVALVDSVGKKARFLSVAVAAATAALREAGADSPLITALQERAEDLAEEPDHREAWDIVTARAVGSLAEVAELGLPLLRVGGRLVCWKRDDGAGTLAGEIRAAQEIVRAAGGVRIRVHHPELAQLPGNVLVEVVKIRPTPGRFPRSASDRKRGLIP